MWKYIVQILAVFNWLHRRRWEWIFGKGDSKDGKT